MTRLGSINPSRRLALRNALNDVAREVFVLDDAEGEALRVCAHVWDGQVQYSSARRDSSGALRLAEWNTYSC